MFFRQKSQITPALTMTKSATSIQHGRFQSLLNDGATVKPSGMSIPNLKTSQNKRHQEYWHLTKASEFTLTQGSRKFPEITSSPGSQKFSETNINHDFSKVPVFPLQLASLLPEIHSTAPDRVAEAFVYYPSDMANRINVNALTLNGNIHLGTKIRDLSEDRLRRLLAHESIHVFQQLEGKRRGSFSDAEFEAHRLAPDIMSGRGVKPMFCSEPVLPLTDTPHDQVVVARARCRLALLRRYLDERATREGRRLRLLQEGRQQLLGQRQTMDRDMPVLVPPGTYEQTEQTHLAQLNRRPLRIALSENTVRFHIRFHARFEDLSDADASARFPTLQSNLLTGIQLIWNQRLSGMPLSGHRFEVIPELTLISAIASRDYSFWLITVRPTDTGPMTYEGRLLGNAPGTIPTSVTDPTVDGGIMSIPPSHITRPGVLGHEVLHLFGLVDRYMAQTQILPSGQRKHVNVPMRESGGLGDPLGAQDAPILVEDLNFLFERLGVYEMEENRGLETLVRIEQTEGLSSFSVLAEVHRLEEIIRLGRDPQSLIRIRTHFRDRMSRDIENL